MVLSLEREVLDFLVSRPHTCFLSRTWNWYALGRYLREMPIHSNFSLQRMTWQWKQHITVDSYDGEAGIHSVLNGILLDDVSHPIFSVDKYLLTINPDVRITLFS